MQAVILKCKPGYRFHLGEFAEHSATTLGQCSDILHSDVIFGAFISILAKNYPEKLEDFRGYFEEGKIKFSSGFFCVEKDEKFTYLLPKPISANFVKFDNGDKKPKVDFKKFKKIKFISQGVYNAGTSVEEWLQSEGKFSQPSSDTLFLSSEISDSVNFKLAEKTDSLKVKVRTTEDDGKLYSQTDLMILGDENHKVHWYFLLEESLDEADKDILTKCIGQLPFTGIGGERSTGCGKIDEVIFQDFETKENTGRKMLLSLAYPDANSAEKLEFYQTKKRGGMPYGKDKRLPARLAVLEGAVLNEDLPQRIDDKEWKAERDYWKYSGALSIALPDYLDKNN